MLKTIYNRQVILKKNNVRLTSYIGYSGKNMYLNATINPVSLVKLIIEREATFEQFRHGDQCNTEKSSREFANETQ